MMLLTEAGILLLMGEAQSARAEVHQAVAECHAAGITPVVIIGDHKLIAEAIVKKLDFFSKPDELVLIGLILTGLDEAPFAAIVERVKVYAFVDPAQKWRIFYALQSRHQFVDITRDGVNDAPLLQARRHRYRHVHRRHAGGH